jgi:hypothetical protein
MLAKKQNVINYHAVYEAVAAKIIRVGKEDGMTNLADLFTKVLTADQHRALCQHILQHLDGRIEYNPPGLP